MSKSSPPVKGAISGNKAEKITPTKDEKPAPISSNDQKEIYEQIKAFENSEAQKMDLDKELESFSGVCTELANLFADIGDMKSSGEIDKDEIEEMKLDGLVYLAKLRRLNRFFKLRLRGVKDEAIEMRGDVDSDHLVYQNLLYEAIHLNKQVSAIKLYKGKDEEIDLIPIEEFYRVAPPNISRIHVTQEDKHLQKIARLEHEYILRQDLTYSIDSLEKEKVAVTGEIDTLKKKLDSIKPMLNKMTEAAKPVEDFFGLTTSVRRANFEKSRYFPFCLHQLYHQSVGYQEALEPEGFKISIGGNLEEAIELTKAENEEPEDENAKSESDKEDSDSDVEKDADEEEKDESSRRKLNRTHSSFGPIALTQQGQDPKTKLSRVHPMFVEWLVTNKDGQNIKIEFYYLLRLQIVLVKAKIISPTHDSSYEKFAEKLLEGERTLSNLYEGDIGLQSPNPSANYLFQSLGLPEEEIPGFEAELYTKLGRPFYWAQRLSGFDLATFFPSCGKPPPSTSKNLSILERINQNEIAHKTVQIETPKITLARTLSLIRTRVKNHLDITEQLRVVESRKFVTNLKTISEDDQLDLFPGDPPISTLVYWKIIEKNEIMGCDSPIGGSNENNLFIKAEISRGPVKFKAFICISHDFPSKPPTFTLFLQHETMELNAKSHIGIRDMEMELNVHVHKDYARYKNSLLPLMMKKLLYMVDIFLETDSLQKGAFSREKFLPEPSKCADNNDDDIVVIVTEPDKPNTLTLFSV